jgi:hypothetical protein
MPTEPQRPEVDLSESSVYNDESPTPAFSAEDIASQSTIDRLEDLTGGPDDSELEDSRLYEGRLGRKVEALDASTDEEIDALELDLHQIDDRSNATDGSGRIVDDVAEERLAEFTEVGPDLDEEGALSVAPGNEDTSNTLRRHHLDTDTARAETVVEGNWDEPKDESLSDANQGPGA